jgi:hypothetical protein
MTPNGSAGATEQARPPARRGASRGWLRLWSTESDDDAYVIRWKRSWTAGAEARWQNTPQIKNPHPAGSKMANAWRAGWGWADQQPDRRTPTVRFAVPQRRAGDRASTLRRSARAGAVGLSAIAVAGWLWRNRRRGT